MKLTHMTPGWRCVANGWIGALLAAAAIILPTQAAQPSLRPPAVPLVACDPYFSIWSGADRLTDVPTTHWTRKENQLTSLVRIDDRAFRVMGAEPSGVAPMKQTSLEVLPTRTIYQFEDAGIHLSLTFMTPALPGNIDLLSRPVTYLTWEAKSVDGAKHAVSVYYDNTAEAVVDDPAQQVTGAAERVGRLVSVKFGSKDQQVLGKTGDDRRIDWGYMYAAAPARQTTSYGLVSVKSRDSFATTGAFTKEPAPGMPSAVNAGAQTPVAALTFAMGNVSDKPVSRWLVLAYDDQYSIQYFKKNLRPYWRRNGMDAAGLLKASANEYAFLTKQCVAFDEELMADLRKVGGEKYAQICALAYRQCMAGNKIAADENGQPLLFPKENTSNGCIGTVDIIYPMAPEFLLFGPSLTKAMLISNLDYASSPRWKWPFAPHDMGTYPKANAQVYGGGELTEENQMPVEETGNMLILVAALAQMEGNVDFVAPYWGTLKRWADYLKDKGFDPENQLCTDDFMGHLAHNVNLSAKAILGLASYGYLCDMKGDKAEAKACRDLAKSFAERWVKEANDGDHFRLAFDKQNTWSQKYNLVWDKILGLDIFPDSVLRKEMDFYKTKLNPFGVSLDYRGKGDLAKLDWSLWTACLTGDAADFDAIMSPVYRYVNESPERVGMGDAYNTVSGHHAFMHSRPVVGGVFLKMLYDKAIWKKWAARDTTRSAHWAPLPVPPKTVVVVPDSTKEPLKWQYTMDKPADGWFKPDFDATAWKEGEAGFGTKGTPGGIVRTTWNTDNIWIRREFELPAGKWSNLHLSIDHDEDATVYINGVMAAQLSGFVSTYEEEPISAEAKATLKPGKNTMAIHVLQTRGGQFIDAGIVDVVPAIAAK